MTFDGQGRQHDRIPRLARRAAASTKRMTHRDDHDRPPGVRCRARSPRRADTGILRWLTTHRSQAIGLSYIVTAFGFFCIGGAARAGMRTAAGAAGRAAPRARRRTTSSSRCTAASCCYLFVGAVRVRSRELHRAAADRRARHGVPAAQRARLLALPVRRAHDARRASSPPSGAANFGWSALRAAVGAPSARRALGGDLWIVGVVLTGTAGASSARSTSSRRSSCCARRA